MITLEQIRQLEGGVKEAMKVVRNLRETNEALVARITDLEERLEENEKAAENRLADEKKIEEGFQGVLDILGEVENGESDPISLTAPPVLVPESVDTDVNVNANAATAIPETDATADDVPETDVADDEPASAETAHVNVNDNDAEAKDETADSTDAEPIVEPEPGEKEAEVTLDVETDAPPEDETDEKFQSEFDIF